MSAEQVILTLMPIMMFVVNISVVAGLWMGAIQVNRRYTPSRRYFGFHQLLEHDYEWTHVD